MQRTKQGDAVANLISRAMPQFHLAAFGRVVDLVVFDRDSRQEDPRTQRVIEDVAAWGEDNDLRVSGAGVSDDGHTWALILRPRRGGVGKLRELAQDADEVLWNSWGFWCANGTLPQGSGSLQKARPMTGLRFYDPVKNWKLIKPHLGDKRLTSTLRRYFGRFTMGRWKKRFESGMVPHDFEDSVWHLIEPGPRRRFWDYVKWGACHWLVNYYLRLAQLVEPNRHWRIVTSDAHSTVWDGGDLLFDLNGVALLVSPERCFDLASKGGSVLAPGRLLKVGKPTHYTLDDSKALEEARRAGWVLPSPHEASASPPAGRKAS